MTLSMYEITVPVFTRYLTGLRKCLGKAEAYAAERKIGAGVLPASRLAPDMHPLSFQVQSATDRVKLGLARLAGRTAPSWADTEATIPELQARIDLALEYLKTFSPADLDGTEAKDITLKMRGQEIVMQGQQMILMNVTPQVFFHITTAYAILRHNGVPIGKLDFVNP